MSFRTSSIYHLISRHSFATKKKERNKNTYITCKFSCSPITAVSVTDYTGEGPSII